MSEHPGGAIGHLCPEFGEHLYISPHRARARMIAYASSGKRDFQNVEEEFENALAELKNQTWQFEENREKVLAYLRACQLGMVKSGGKNRKVGKSTLYRVMGILRLLSERWIKKDFTKTTENDWVEFYMMMEEGKLKQENGKPYKQTTRAKLYKTIRKFLAYLGLKHFTEKWDFTEETPNKGHLTRSQVEQMIEASSLKMKTVIMTLFDGGFRAEEFANLRWVDLVKKQGKYYQAHVRSETSKTKKERHVSLWIASDYLDSYKQSEMTRLGKDFKNEGYLYEGDYGSLHKALKRIGERAIGKPVNPHMLRHSSATYYANIVKTYQLFCYRYGWSLKSGMAQRYFHPKDDEEIAEQAKDHEIARFKTDFERVQLENQSLKERVDELAKQQARLSEVYTTLSRAGVLDSALKFVAKKSSSK